MNSTFVRKDFYLDPPQKDATIEEWQEWLKKDKRKAAAAKALHTRSLKHSEVPDEFQESVARKVNGRWTQCTMVGFTGSPDSNVGIQVERAINSNQEKLTIFRDMELNRNIRGGNRKGKSYRRHANKKRRKLSGSK